MSDAIANAPAAGSIGEVADAATFAGSSAQGTAPERRDELRAVAVELEATFLAEMLKHAGLGEIGGAFGGGAGEAQFASFLRLEQARAMADSGGVGLAETLFQALAAREGLAEGTR